MQVDNVFASTLSFVNGVFILIFVAITNVTSKNIFSVPYGQNGVGPNYDEIGNHFQGDILGVTFNKGEARNVIRNLTRKWPDGVVPYVIDIIKFKQEHINIIKAAIQEFHQFTCVRFVPHSTELNFVSMISNTGCNSYVGRSGLMQTMSLEIPGCLTKGIVMHELMHALGIWHEHSRSDRDEYIAVNWENIPLERQYNFQKLDDEESQTFDLSYDYGSIMHYSAYGFAKNTSIPTIVPTKGKDIKIGQRKGFSKTDIDKINHLYECNRTLLTP